MRSGGAHGTGSGAGRREGEGSSKRGNEEGDDADDALLARAEAGESEVRVDGSDFTGEFTGQHQIQLEMKRRKGLGGSSRGWGLGAPDDPSERGPRAPKSAAGAVVGALGALGGSAAWAWRWLRALFCPKEEAKAHSPSSAALRPLLPSTPVLYYAAIVLDFLLRVLWSFKLSVHLHLTQEGLTFVLEMCEVMRRALWLLFRIEWETIDKEDRRALSAVELVPVGPASADGGWATGMSPTSAAEARSGPLRARTGSDHPAQLGLQPP